MSLKQQLLEMDDMERRTFLETNAESVHEDMSYVYQFSEDELEEMRKSYIEVSQKLRKLDDEKAEFLAEMREKMKLPKANASELLDNITDGFQKREGNVYVLHDYEEHKIYQVTDDGNIILERSLVAGMQTSVLSVKKAM